MRNFRRFLPKIFLITGICSLGTSLTVLGLEIKRVGNIPLAIRSLEGHHLVVTKSSINVDFSETGERKTVEYTIQNLTSNPINLVGSLCSCSCTVVENLPTLIAPFQSRKVAVTIAAASIDAFGGEIELYTDDANDKILRLAFIGRVARKE